MSLSVRAVHQIFALNATQITIYMIIIHAKRFVMKQLGPKA